MQPQRTIQTLLTDSRSPGAAEGTLFFAIRTSTGDGTRYMRPLYERGVRAFVAPSLPDDMRDVEDATIIIVDDVVSALQGATARRPEFGGLMVGITGSRGKTTLKEWLFQLTEPLAEVVRSPRSYNSQIGVPLSMWEVTPATDLAIIEAGISRRGEMAALAACIQPDITVLTNITAAHAEGFASDEEKALEKLQLALAPSVKTVVYNADDPLFAPLAATHCQQLRHASWRLTRSEEKDTTADAAETVAPPAIPPMVEGEIISHTSAQTAISFIWHPLPDIEEGVKGEIHLPAVGGGELPQAHMLENAMNALTVTLEFLLSRTVRPDRRRLEEIVAKVSDRFRALQRVDTRLNVSDGINGCTVVYDHYLSDVSSLGPALDFVARRATPGQSRTLILSDLHAAGTQRDGEEALYRAAARIVEEAGISRVIGVGEAMSRWYTLFGHQAVAFPDTDALLESISTSDFSDEIVLLKGSVDYGFSRILDTLEARTHETVLEVNLDAIVRNYNYFRSFLPSGTGMIAMVKASGYGAGSYEIAKTLQDIGAAYLAVAVLDEGIDLRRRGITMPIMVMNPKVVNYRAMFAHSLEPEIYSMSMLEDVIREARKNGVKHYPVHIKLDTGMHRMGFLRHELPALATLLASQEYVQARSLFTHLATADCLDMDSYTLQQLEAFKEYSDYLISHSRTPILRHVLNSAGIIRFPQYHYDMARLGIGLYGANTLPADLEKPLSVVSTLRTVIISVREYPEGTTIGYGRRGEVKGTARIATLPIGYADGINRRFGNGAMRVMVNGHEAPTIGNICMDACMIDVTGIDCAEGDSVEIFGANLPVQRLADLLGTIPYEILTSVSPRVKRVYYRE